MGWYSPDSLIRISRSAASRENHAADPHRLRSAFLVLSRLFIRIATSFGLWPSSC
jgi:hypothetical protein